jgi:hypothetical protein
LSAGDPAAWRDDHRGHKHDLAEHLGGLAADVDQDPLSERLPALLLNQRHEQAKARRPLRDVGMPVRNVSPAANR